MQETAADMGDKGTENNGDWYIVDEAECLDSLESLEELFENSTEGSNISNLIDDVDEVDEGPPLALYNQQITEECNKTIADLKRKYMKSPDRLVGELSPRLQAVEISPQRPGSKRRLFGQLAEDETQNINQQAQVVTAACSASNENGGETLNIELLNSNNRRNCILGRFKDKFGVSYSELTRQFRSNKTCTENWVIIVNRASDNALEASKVVLQGQCLYLQLITIDNMGLYLLQCKSAKNRDTIMNVFTGMLGVPEYVLLCDPPKTKSVPAALYFYQKGLSNISYVFGSTPDWIARLTLAGHSQAAQAESFQLSEMVQWALDNGYSEEHEIAYKYAVYAEEDANATAFLRSNQQVKYVRDCTQMVRLYRRHQMRSMTMSEWIQKCCTECTEEGNWKKIAAVLRYQSVNVVQFLTAVRLWLKGVPKKNCIVIYGNPDTGKSYFCFTLLKFLKGKVVSYMNRNSQFWLQPLQDCKIGYVDDCTYACWQYMDTNMRAALDGNHISMDAKHRAPTQIKLPPLLMSSNINIHKEPTLLYLQSRIVGFEFPNKMLLTDEGQPVYDITDADWKSFFIRLATQLDLCFQEEGDESERTDRAFRCTAGSTAESN